MFPPIMSMLLARAARPAVLHAARGCAAALTGRASLYAAAGASKRPRAVAVASEIARMAPSWKTSSQIQSYSAITVRNRIIKKTAKDLAKID